MVFDWIKKYCNEIAATIIIVAIGLFVFWFIKEAFRLPIGGAYSYLINTLAAIGTIGAAWAAVYAAKEAKNISVQQIQDSKIKFTHDAFLSHMSSYKNLHNRYIFNKDSVVLAALLFGDSELLYEFKYSWLNKENFETYRSGRYHRTEASKKIINYLNSFSNDKNSDFYNDLQSKSQIQRLIINYIKNLSDTDFQKLKKDFPKCMKLESNLWLLRNIASNAEQIYNDSREKMLEQSEESFKNLDSEYSKIKNIWFNFNTFLELLNTNSVNEELLVRLIKPYIDDHCTVVNRIIYFSPDEIKQQYLNEYANLVAFYKNHISC